MEAEDSGASFEEDDPLGRRLQQSLEQIKEGLAKTAGNLFTEQKNLITEECREISCALKEAGNSLHSRSQQELLPYVEQADEQIQRFSDYIGRLEPHRALPETNLVFQRNQLLFLGGSLALGFVLGRLLKASGLT